MDNTTLTTFTTSVLGTGQNQLTRRELVDCFKRVPSLSYRCIAVYPVDDTGCSALIEVMKPMAVAGCDFIYRVYRSLGTSLLERNGFFSLTQGKRKRLVSENAEVALGVSLLHSCSLLEEFLADNHATIESVYQGTDDSIGENMKFISTPLNLPVEHAEENEGIRRSFTTDPGLLELAEAFLTEANRFVERSEYDRPFAGWTLGALGQVVSLYTNFGRAATGYFFGPRLLRMGHYNRRAENIWRTSCAIGVEALEHFGDYSWLISLSKERRAELDAWCASPDNEFVMRSFVDYICWILVDPIRRVDRASLTA